MTTPVSIALLVIDIQKELFEKSTPIYAAGQLIENICKLIDQAHSSDVPVFFIQHSSDKILIQGTPGWQFHPRLQPLETDSIIQKHHGNAFEETSLDDELKALGIKQLIVTGLVTHGCVKATCLGAQALGYQVILVKDAHSNYHKKAEEVIAEWNEKLRQAGVSLLNAEEVCFQAEKIS